MHGVRNVPPLVAHDFFTFVAVYTFVNWQAVSRLGIERSDRKWYDRVRTSTNCRYLIPSDWLYGTLWYVLGTLASVSIWLTFRSLPETDVLAWCGVMIFLNVVFEKNWAIFFWLREMIFGVLRGVEFAVIIAFGMVATSICAWVAMIMAWTADATPAGPEGTLSIIVYGIFVVWTAYMCVVTVIFAQHAEREHRITHGGRSTHRKCTWK